MDSWERRKLPDKANWTISQIWYDFWIMKTRWTSVSLIEREHNSWSQWFKGGLTRWVRDPLIEREFFGEIKRTKGFSLVRRDKTRWVSLKKFSHSGLINQISEKLTKRIFASIKSIFKWNVLFLKKIGLEKCYSVFMWCLIVEKRDKMYE